MDEHSRPPAPTFPDLSPAGSATGEPASSEPATVPKKPGEPASSEPATLPRLAGEPASSEPATLPRKPESSKPAPDAGEEAFEAIPPTLAEPPAAERPAAAGTPRAAVTQESAALPAPPETALPTPGAQAAPASPTVAPAPASPDAPAVAEKPPPKGLRPWLVVAVGLPAFLVGVVLAAHRPVLAMMVRGRAADLGVEVDWDELDASFDSVRLTRARASLAGVRGVKVTAASVRLGRDGLSVASVDAEGVAVTLEGPATDRVLDLAAWSGSHADAYRLRGSATNVRLDWRARPDTPAWLTMTGGSLTADGATARFGATATAFGVPMGAVSASVAVASSGVTIEAGKRQGAEPPLVAKLAPSAKPPTLSLTLRPVELSALGTALGLTLPSPGAVVKGSVDLTLGRAPAGIAGTASLDIDGWVPAHPRQLDGVIFGKKTSLRTRLQVSEDRAAVKLDDLEVRAGRLALKGSGSITEDSSHALVRLDVGGPIACSELARSAATQELGGWLGEIAAEVAGRAVGGTATVNVSVEADSRDLGAAKVKPRVANGCGLKLPGL